MLCFYRKFSAFFRNFLVTSPFYKLKASFCSGQLNPPQLGTTKQHDEILLADSDDEISYRFESFSQGRV